MYTQEMIDRIAEYALNAGRAAQHGESGITLGTGTTVQRLNLLDVGMCQRFVRQIVETACGFKAFGWRYATAHAKDALAAMSASGLRRDGGIDPLPGDIGGHRRGKSGHIGIYVGLVDGVPTVAENTTGIRGNPRRSGTKLTPLSDFTGTEWYRLPMAPVPAKQETVPIKIMRVTADGYKIIHEFEMHPDGDHIKDQGKVYVLSGD